MHNPSQSGTLDFVMSRRDYLFILTRLNRVFSNVASNMLKASTLGFTKVIGRNLTEALSWYSRTENSSQSRSFCKEKGQFKGHCQSHCIDRRSYIHM